MLKWVSEFHRVSSFQNIKLFLNINTKQNIFKSKFSSHTREEKFKYELKLSEKDLTPTNYSWDSPDIKTVGDIDHKLRLSRYNRRHDVDFYLRLIKGAAKEGNTEKMLSVFFHDMLIRDRVKPNIFIINQLLIELSNLGGHSESSFRILNKIKSLRIEPNMVTYSLLFKNCAREVYHHNLYFNVGYKGIKLLSDEELEQYQSPARRAFSLWKSRVDADEPFDLPTTNSLLLAINRAGMLKESCIILDRFFAQGNRGDDYTLSALIEGCLTDQRNGFGLVLIFYNMLSSHCRLSASPYVISNLLNVASKCQFGGASLINRLLKHSTTPNHKFLEVFEATTPESGALVKADMPVVHNCPREYNLVITDTSRKYNIQVDNFLDSHWSPGSELIYLLKSPTNMLKKNFINYFDPRWLEGDLSPASKLACIGGILGIINLIKQCGASPNIHTFSSLLKCLPYTATIHQDFGTKDLFNEVIRKLMNHFKIPEDPAFKNALLKRNIKLNLDTKFEAINTANFDPYTWSCYAKMVRNVDDVKNFLNILSENQIVADKHIFMSLFTSVYNWGPRLYILQKIIRLNIVPDRELLVVIESEICKMKTKIPNVGDDPRGAKVKELFYKFQSTYTEWLNHLKIASVDTGKRTSILDSLPPDYKER